MSEKKNPPMPPRSEEEVVFGDELPVLPIRNAVLFPGAVAPFDVGREKSVALVEDVDNLPGPVIAIFAQRDPSTDDPGGEDLYPVGCAARVLKALKQRRGVPPHLAQAEGFVSGTALFGGFKRRFAGNGFQGGELTAIFGGFELDLRQSQLGSEPRRLDIFALFGGGSIYVPEGWEVSVNVSSIFGGVDQKNLPVPLGTSGAPRLTITGTALFGGVEIRN